MVAWTSNFTAEPKSYSFGNFHSLFHPPPSVLSSSLFFFSSQIYLHLLPPPNPSSHTYRRVQYVTWQQQSKCSPAYVLFKARTTSFTTSVKCTFSPGLTLHYQLLALMAVWGIQWCNSLKTKHEQPWKGVRAGKQIFFTIWSPHIYPTSSTAASPHLHFCPGKVLPSVWKCGLPHLPPPQHSSFSLVKGQGASLTGIGAIWLRAAIIPGIFCQSINITALGRPYAKEISELPRDQP